MPLGDISRVLGGTAALRQPFGSGGLHFFWGMEASCQAVFYGGEVAAARVSGGVPRASSMAVKLLIFVSVNVFGALGWSAGERFGFMTAFVCSGIGSVLGVYIGWVAARRLLE